MDIGTRWPELHPANFGHRVQYPPDPDRPVHFKHFFGAERGCAGVLGE